MPGYDGWQLIGRPIGRGGQGSVYKARSPEREGALRKTQERIAELLRTAGLKEDVALVSEFAQRIVEAGSIDPPASLGALKIFDIPADNPAEEAQAVGRLKSEVSALSKIDHPAVLKLLYHNIDDRFFVTQFHQHGTMDQERNLVRYKGNPLGALEAFGKLVAGVVEIQKLGLIHRDIKLQNIFVADSGDMVLGDLGIVFFQEGGRQTTTFEMVGSHFWMPPWAYKYERLSPNEIKWTLDVYPLGKLLWSMVAGRRGFPREDFRRDENDLEKLFTDPAMSLINELLTKCVVPEENDCLPTALELQFAVSGTIAKIKTRHGQRPEGDEIWPCRICGRGKYHRASGHGTGIAGPLTDLAPNRPGDPPDRHFFSIFVCDYCKHAELFG